MRIQPKILTLGLVLLVISAGCTTVLEPQLAHTVNVYNTNYQDSEYQSHNITIIVKNGAGEILYNQTYNLGNKDQTDESGSFSAEKDPKTILIRLDGNKSVHEWPAIDCGESTRMGVEITVRSNEKDQISISGIRETETVEGKS